MHTLKKRVRVSRFLIICIGLAFGVALLGCAARADTPRVYWGVNIDGVPRDMQKLAAFEKLAGKRVSIVHWAQPWWRCDNVCGYQPFSTVQVQFEMVRAHGAIPLLDWASWDSAARPVTSQPQFSLKTILRGDHDEYIRQWAAEAKAWEYPFFLRFNWEMNGNWFPWSEELNGNARGEYVRAWRHVRDIFTAVGATNVTWVWSPAALDARAVAFESFYPGDTYVDWVGTSIYNWASYRRLPWISFHELFSPTYAAMMQLAPRKPLMIAEIASVESMPLPRAGLSKGRWIREAFSERMLDAYPQVGAIVWFNWDEDDPKLSWELESSPDALVSFAHSISADVFAENSFSELEDAPIEFLRQDPNLGVPRQ